MRLLLLLAAFFAFAAPAHALEAEDMSLPPGSEVQTPLGWASGDAYVTLREAGSLTASVNLPASDRIHVSAREGFDCGDVSMTVRVDGAFVFSVSVDGIPFGLYTVPLALSAGQHSVEVEYPQDTDEFCDTTLRVDAVTFRAAPTTGYQPPFSREAVFNKPVPSDKPDDPLSDAFVTEWTRTVRANPSSTHVKTSGEVPAVNFTAGCPSRSFQTGNVSGTFPICNDIQLGSGSDHPTILVNGFDELRIWQATWDGTTLRGTLGGRFCRQDSLSCLGQPYAGGGAGNGLTYSAGLNVPADFIGTSTPHHSGRVALDGRFVRSSFRPPARKSDQDSTASYAVPMGSVLQIRPSVDCNARSNQVARDLCHQFQTYGLMVSDGSSSNQVVIYHEDNVTASWSSVFGPPCSSGNWSCRIRPGSNALDGLPWNASDWRVVSAPASNTAW